MPITPEILLETAYLCVLWGALGGAVGLLCRQGIEAYTARVRKRVPQARRAAAEAAARQLALEAMPETLEATHVVPAAAEARMSEPRTSHARS